MRIVPLHDVECEFVDDWLVIKMFSEAHCSAKQRVAHEVSQCAERQQALVVLLFHKLVIVCTKTSNLAFVNRHCRVYLCEHANRQHSE